MTVIEYITKHTTKQGGLASIYKCNISNLHFSWEDVDMHMNWLERNKLI